MANSKVGLITTVDNPYNPDTNWEEWHQWDETHGYHTLERMAKLRPIPAGKTSQYAEEMYDEAAAELITMFPNLYVIVPQT